MVPWFFSERGGESSVSLSVNYFVVLNDIEDLLKAEKTTERSRKGVVPLK